MWQVSGVVEVEAIDCSGDTGFLSVSIKWRYQSLYTGALVMVSDGLLGLPRVWNVKVAVGIGWMELFGTMETLEW